MALDHCRPYGRHAHRLLVPLRMTVEQPSHNWIVDLSVKGRGIAHCSDVPHKIVLGCKEHASEAIPFRLLSFH